MNMWLMIASAIYSGGYVVAQRLLARHWYAEFEERSFYGFAWACLGATVWVLVIPLLPVWVVWRVTDGRKK